MNWNSVYGHGVNHEEISILYRNLEYSWETNALPSGLVRNSIISFYHTRRMYHASSHFRLLDLSCVQDYFRLYKLLQTVQLRAYFLHTLSFLIPNEISFFNFSLVTQDYFHSALTQFVRNMLFSSECGETEQSPSKVYLVRGQRSLLKAL